MTWPSSPISGTRTFFDMNVLSERTDNARKLLSREFDITHLSPLKIRTLALATKVALNVLSNSFQSIDSIGPALTLYIYKQLSALSFKQINFAFFHLVTQGQSSHAFAYRRSKEFREAEDVFLGITLSAKILCLHLILLKSNQTIG